MGKIRNWDRAKRGLRKDFREVRWDYTKFPQHISVTYDGHRWGVWLWDVLGGGSDMELKGGFRTKERAMKFATAWMRRHPNG